MLHSHPSLLLAITANTTRRHKLVLYAKCAPSMPTKPAMCMASHLQTAIDAVKRCILELALTSAAIPAGLARGVLDIALYH